MASIDYGTLALGTLIGIGCRKQLKAASRVAANFAANLASATAVAVSEAAEATKSPEKEKAAEFLEHIDQQIAGQAGNGKNG